MTALMLLVAASGMATGSFATLALIEWQEARQAIRFGPVCESCWGTGHDTTTLDQFDTGIGDETLTVEVTDHGTASIVETVS